MLTEKRQEEIVRLVYERESITVAELKEILHSSESTIRRDIIALDQEGRLTKVFGGAIALRTAQIVNKELSMVQKKDLQIAEKQAIARYAASLIERDDCVYLDAGTSTGWMIEY
ncbi:DeoR family transcriptional regulator, partial [Gallintestinimicrobium sp.]